MAEFDPNKKLEVDAETGDLVERLARRLGVSEAEAVRRAMAALEEKVTPKTGRPDFVEWMKAHRKANPLPPSTGLKADKAFFDDLWGEAP